MDEDSLGHAAAAGLVPVPRLAGIAGWRCRRCRSPALSLLAVGAVAGAWLARFVLLRPER